MIDPLLKKIENAGEAALLTDTAVRALIALARDPHGLERHAAASMIASSLDISMEGAQEAVIELFAKGLVVETGSPEARVNVDLKRLGLSDDEANTLRSRRTVFENHGAPHSTKAMSSLRRLFEETEGTLYVGLEVTAPSVFSALERRAKKGKQTIFLMPRRSAVLNQRKRHYDEIKGAWLEYFREREPVVRRNTELRVSETPFGDLYTSALSKDLARFDVHFVDSGTTRDGDILEVKRGTTLYELIAARYQVALARSCPLWRIWWRRALSFWAMRLIFPGLLIALGLALAASTNPFAAVFVTLALGTLANILSQTLGVERWYRPSLFER